MVLAAEDLQEAAAVALEAVVSEAAEAASQAVAAPVVGAQDGDENFRSLALMREGKEAKL